MFKYQTYFEKLSTLCPPKNYIAENKIAFRWIFDDIKNDENFKPVYFKNPKRFNEKSDEERCIAMGLSFFETLETAEHRFLKLKKRLGQEAYKILGCQIAKGQIMEEDGVNSPADMNGHFTHHPSINFTYFEKIIIVKSLK
jgi:hypothetical protein